MDDEDREKMHESIDRGLKQGRAGEGRPLDEFLS